MVSLRPHYFSFRGYFKNGRRVGGSSEPPEPPLNAQLNCSSFMLSPWNCGWFGTDAKLEESTCLRPRRFACFEEEDAFRSFFYSLVAFLLPYMLAFQPTYATLIVFCLKANRVTAGVNEHYNTTKRR